MLIIILVIILIFLVNFFIHWRLISEIKPVKPRISEFYKKVFPIIWNFCLISIPVINSSFFQPFFTQNISYFYKYWLWFIAIGIVLIILGFKIYSLAVKLLKSTKKESEMPKLLRKGIYEIIRHPQYLAWILIYFGISFIFDSFVAIVFSPILIISTEFLVVLEEKYVLNPIFKETYEHYKKKTPYRLFPPPYNYIFIILGFIIVYIGFLNIIGI